MKSALARMFTNTELAVTKLQTFQARARKPGHAHRRLIGVCPGGGWRS